MLQLAEETQLKAAINSMFSGEKSMKPKKSRSTYCFKDFSDKEILVDGENIKPAIKKVLNQMKTFSEK